ncbi:MAG TPA: DNA polymerase III subunit delta [Clostridia bacterium]|nr:DNA polymerase III subunit delta [Clostridia bacterium]
MNYNRLKAELGEKRIRNLYLLYGDEPYLIGKLVERIIAIAEEEAGKDIERSGFGADVSPADLEMAVGTNSFFGSGRIIICRDTGIFKGKSRFEAFMDVLGRIPVDVYVIFIEKDVDEKNELFSEMKKAGYAYKIEMRKSSEIMGYIAGRFKKQEKKITAANLSLFVELSGTSLQDIESDIEKILLFMGDLKEVRREYILNLCSGSSTHRIYELMDAIFTKNGDRAHFLMKELWSDKMPVQVMISSIHSRLLELLEVKMAVARGDAPVILRNNRPVQDFIIDILKKQAAGYSEKALRSFIIEAAELDYRIKSGEIAGETGLLVLVNEITGV